MIQTGFAEDSRTRPTQCLYFIHHQEKLIYQRGMPDPAIEKEKGLCGGVSCREAPCEHSSPLETTCEVAVRDETVLVVLTLRKT